MGSVVTTEANGILTSSVKGTAYTAPTAPINLALVTVIGSASAAGTEVTGGSYARQPITWGTASAGSIANSVAITFTAMPAVTVVGVDIWDSAGTPIRRWWGAVSPNKVLGSGDTLSFAIGALSVGLT